MNLANDTLKYRVRIRSPFKVLAMIADGDQATLRANIVSNSGGIITACDLFAANSFVFRRPDSILALGYKAIYTWDNQAYAGGAAAFGDSLAKFIDLGGGTVASVYANYSTWTIGGAYAARVQPGAIRERNRFRRQPGHGSAAVAPHHGRRLVSHGHCRGHYDYHGDDSRFIRLPDCQLDHRFLCPVRGV